MENQFERKVDSVRKGIRAVLALLLSFVMACMPLANAGVAYADSDAMTEEEHSSSMDALEEENGNNNGGNVNREATLNNQLQEIIVQDGDPTPYDIWVGNRQITNENATDVFNDGTVSYDESTKTLTLNGYSNNDVKYVGEYVDGAAIYINSEDNLTIIVKGTNNLTSTTEYGMAIRQSGAGKITVKGEGTSPTLNLAVKDDVADTGYAVSVKGTEASFEDLEMSVKGSMGILVNAAHESGDTLTISNCKMTFEGKKLDQALYVNNESGDGTMQITNSEVTGQGAIFCYGYGADSGDAFATITNSTIRLSGSTLDAASRHSRHAIEVLSKVGDSRLIIDGSTVEATATNGLHPGSSGTPDGNGPDGINVGSQETKNGKGAAEIVIKNGSTVRAVGKANGLNIFTWGDETTNPCGTKLTVIDSELETRATDADYGFYGITAYAYKKGDTEVTFTNSKITASATRTAGISLGASGDYNSQVGNLKLTSTNSTITTAGPYGLYVSTVTASTQNQEATQTVNITGGSFTCTGGVFVYGDDGENKANLTFENVEGSVDITGSKDVSEAMVTGTLSIPSGKYKFIYGDETTGQTAADVNKGNVTGGIFTENVNTEDMNLCPDGYACVPNTDEATKGEYPWMVGKSQLTITFDAAGGTDVQDQTVDFGKVAIEPTSTRTGYALDGWYEGDTKFDFSVPVVADHDLNAHWIANTYKVSYNANGGRGNMADQSFTYDVAQNLTKNAFARDGYTFTAWNTKADGSGTAYKDAQSVTLSNNLTLYAQWKQNEKPKPANVSVSYSGHVQNVGDVGPVADGDTCGTTKQSLRLEAISANVKDGTIEYRSHVQNTGWEGTWTKNGDTSGTVGKGLRIEAIQMRLSGDISATHDVFYRIHVQDYGWLGWAKDGEVAGTSGRSMRAEAYEVVVLPKGQVPKGYDATNPAFVGYLRGNAHVQNQGWQTIHDESSIFGTTGMGLRMEALSIRLGTLPDDLTGSIEYTSHVQNVGWESGWASDGSLSGTTGRGLRAEAVKIKLTGDVSARYGVWYRVHVQNRGWSGWATDGNPAGSEGLSLRAEAVELCVLPVGAPAPGSTDNTLFT